MGKSPNKEQLNVLLTKEQIAWLRAKALREGQAVNAIVRQMITKFMKEEQHGNTQAIGAGLYDMLTAEDKTVVGFGMIPKKMLDLVMDMVKNKVAEIMCVQMGIDACPENITTPPKKHGSDYNRGLSRA